MQNTLSIAEPDASVAVEETKEELHLVVSPNPVSTVLNIRFPDHASITDAVGQTVLHTTVQGSLQTPNVTNIPTSVCLSR